MAQELVTHGAPRDLVRRARRAKRDEIRHARVMMRFAAREGATVPRVVAAALSPRSLEAMAIENAVEGCVRETFGAALAHVQARAALDVELRMAMVRIAEDETRHAGLSWGVAAWLDTRLDPRARRRVLTARKRAVDELRKTIDEARLPPSELARLGIPARAAAILDALDEALLHARHPVAA